MKKADIVVITSLAVGIVLTLIYFVSSPSDGNRSSGVPYDVIHEVVTLGQVKSPTFDPEYGAVTLQKAIHKEALRLAIQERLRSPQGESTITAKEQRAFDAQAERNLGLRNQDGSLNKAVVQERVNLAFESEPPLARSLVLAMVIIATGVLAFSSRQVWHYIKAKI